MNSTKVLICIIILLVVTLCIVFVTIFSSDNKDSKEEINKNPSSIQDRRNALKEVFK